MATNGPELIDRLIREEGEFMAALTERLAAVTQPRAQLRAMLEAIAGDCDVSTLIETWSHVRRDSELFAARQKVDDEFRMTFERIIGAGQAGGDFGDLDPGEAAMSLMAIVDGFVIQATLHDPEVTPAYMLSAVIDAAELLLECELPPSGGPGGSSA
jgi:hypothetical protein